LSNGPAASDNNTQDYRNSNGYNLTSPEYLSVFNGETGAEISTISFDPARGSSVNTWGDSYGNRADRFLAAIAYLDGVNPSLIMGRGYYQAQSGYESKTGIAAYDFNGTTLTKKWTFWANTATNLNESYIGQGNHNLSVADVDQDGFDELIYGSMTIDHNGTGKYSTGFGHGDALYVTDLDPDRAGLEVFQPHEEVDRPYGISFRDSKTGAVIWGFDANYDVGRAVSADVNPNYKGYESWASGFGMYSCKGVKITDNLPISTGTTTSINHVVWWDGDLLREIFDKSVINKYNYTDGSTTRLWTLYNEGIASNNGTKENPALTADIFGDWREEVIMRSADNSQLLIFNSTSESPHKLYCLMHDPVYRCAIAWQNVGYNQPPQVGYYLGVDMASPVKPNVLLVGKVYEPTLSNPVNKSQSVLDTTPIETIVYTWGGAATDVVLTDLPFGLNFVKDITAKTLTITGTPIVTGNYTVTTVGGTEAAVVVTGSITVLPNPPTLSNPTNKTQTVTSGTAITPIIFTWGGGATDVSTSNLPAGLLIVKDADARTLTIYGTPIVSGTYTVTTVGGSGVDLVIDGTITVLPAISCLELIKIPIYGVPVSGIYSLILFDSTGNTEIKTLSTGYFNAGNSEFIVLQSEIASGSYMFKLLQGALVAKSGLFIVP
jgi:rhamnogalacturonan endolyase